MVHNNIFHNNNKGNVSNGTLNQFRNYKLQFTPQVKFQDCIRMNFMWIEWINSSRYASIHADKNS